MSPGTSSREHFRMLLFCAGPWTYNICGLMGFASYRMTPWNGKGNRQRCRAYIRSHILPLRQHQALTVVKVCFRIGGRHFPCKEGIALKLRRKPFTLIAEISLFLFDPVFISL